MIELPRGDAFLSLSECAELLGMSPGDLRNRHSRGTFIDKAGDLGARSPAFRRSQVLEWDAYRTRRGPGNPQMQSEVGMVPETTEVGMAENPAPEPPPAPKDSPGGPVLEPEPEPVGVNPALDQARRFLADHAEFLKRRSPRAHSTATTSGASEKEVTQALRIAAAQLRPAQAKQAREILAALG